MPHYLKEALHKFQLPVPKRPQYAPYSWNRPTYGAAVQYSANDNISPLLPAKYITLIQNIVRALLYFSIAVNPTMPVALGSIASQQTKATKKTCEETLWLLNYAASHPDATIHYRARYMVLHIHSDASYISEPQA